MASRTNTAKLTIIINGKEVKKNLSDIGDQVGKLNRDLRKLTPGTEEFIKKTEELKKARSAYADIKKEIQGVPSLFDKMAKSAGGFLSIIGIGIGIQSFTAALSNAYSIVKDFDSAQSELAAILGKSKAEIAGLTALTLKLGATTAFTATQATQAATELAKLGFTEKEIAQSLEGIIDGAVALGSEIPETAELVAATLKSFGLQAKDTGRVVSTLAAGANATSLGFESLKTSLGNVAPAAAAANYSIEQTVALLGLITDNGIDASTAGTSLRNMLIKLSESGMTLDEALNQIASSQDKLTKATELFDVRSAVSAIALAGQKDKVSELTDALTGQEAVLKEMAKTRLDNLEGSLTLLKSAWEGLILSIENGNGTIAKGIRKIVDFGTSILNFLTPQKTAIEQTKEEQFELNKLVAEITSTNIKVDDRVKLINGLQEKYPGFLGNLDKEKVTNEQLRDRLYEVNDAYIQKLALQKTEEKYKGILEDQADLISLQAEKQRKLFDNLNQSVVELSRKGIKLPSADRSDLEGSYKKIQAALRDIQKQQGEINGAKFGGLFQVNSQLLGDVQNINAKLAEQSTKVEEAKREFEFEANVVRSTIGIVDNLKNSVSNVTDATTQAIGAAENLQAAWSGIKVPAINPGTLRGLNDILKDYNTQLLSAPIGSADAKTLQSLIKQTKNQIDEATGKADEERRRKAEEASRKAQQDSKQAQNKAQDERKKLQQQAIKEEEKFQKSLLEAERKYQDETYSLMIDGLVKEQILLSTDYARKKEDIRKEIEDLEKLQKEYIDKSSQALKLGDPATGAKFKKLAADQILIITERNATIEALEDIYAAKRLKLVYQYRQKELQEIQRLNKQESDALQINHNQQLASVTSLETAKALLKDVFSEEELKKIKTLEEAKKQISIKQQQESYDVQRKQLEQFQSELEAELAKDAQSQELGLGSLFTEEQKNAMIDRLNEVKVKLSEVKLAAAGNKSLTSQEKEQREAGAKSQLLSEIDLLGFTAEQWDQAFNQLDTAKTKMEEWAAKIQLVSMSVKTMQNAWSMMYQAQATASQRAIQQYEAETSRKKEALKQQLDQGYINQSQYDAKIKKLEADMQARRADMEYKLNMQKYKMDISNAISNTALGVTRALSSANFVLAALVAAQGALQVGIITQNKPQRAGYARGGVTTGLGFKDDSGYEVAGVVHAQEYVIPKWLRKDPEVAQLEQYIEYKRKGGSNSFAKGGEVSYSPPSPVTENNSSDERVIELLQEQNKLITLLVDKEAVAYIKKDVKQMQALKEEMKKSDEIINNGKIVQ
jgi:hypothetical protein